MVKVTITYNDGRVVHYDTLREASKDLGIDHATIKRLAMPRSSVRKWLGIAEVRFDRDPWEIRTSRPRHGAVPIRCINAATGEVREYASLEAAKRGVRDFDGHYIPSQIGTGKPFCGWYLELIDKSEASQLTFRAPVSDEVIIQARRYAWHALKQRPGYDRLPRADRHDCVDDAVAHVASEVSMGRSQEAYKSFDAWLYSRVMSYIGSWLARYYRYRDGLADTENELDEWYDNGDGEDLAAIDAEADLWAAMPEEFQPLARLILAGHGKMDCAMHLGIGERKERALRAGLGEWLRQYREERRG